MHDLIIIIVIPKTVKIFIGVYTGDIICLGRIVGCGTFLPS